VSVLTISDLDNGILISPRSKGFSRDRFEAPIASHPIPLYISPSSLSAPNSLFHPNHSRPSPYPELPINESTAYSISSALPRTSQVKQLKLWWQQIVALSKAWQRGYPRVGQRCCASLSAICRVSGAKAVGCSLWGDDVDRVSVGNASFSRDGRSLPDTLV
jgi:hypothetical protein